MRSVVPNLDGLTMAGSIGGRVEEPGGGTVTLLKRLRLARGRQGKKGPGEPAPASVSPGQVHRLSKSPSSRPESIQDSTNLKDVHRIESAEAVVKPLWRRPAGVEILSPG